MLKFDFNKVFVGKTRKGKICNYRSLSYIKKQAYALEVFQKVWWKNTFIYEKQLQKPSGRGKKMRLTVCDRKVDRI